MDIVSLIARLKRGDEPAYKELVFAFSSRLMTTARIYAVSEEEAKDVLQEAFILVFRKIKDFEGAHEAAFYSWMKRLVINLSLSRNQKKYRSMEKGLDTLVLNQHKVEATAISNLTHEEIMQMVFKLPDGYRQVFALYAVEGYSHKEIAEKLSIGVSSSRSQYSRARKMLQSSFQKLFTSMIA